MRHFPGNRSVPATSNARFSCPGLGVVAPVVNFTVAAASANRTEAGHCSERAVWLSRSMAVFLDKSVQHLGCC